MRTVVLGPPPAEINALIARRHALGLDTHDEIWEGEYHMAPAAHFSHALLDDEPAVALHPLARAAGLIGSGPFNLGEPSDFRVPDRGLHRGRPTSTFLPTAAVVVEILSPRRAEASGLLGEASLDLAAPIDWPPIEDQPA